MKKLIIAAIFILLAGVAFCQNKSDIEKEKKAIMAVLQEEGNAHAEHDLEGLQKAYINDSHTVRVHTRKNNYSILEGWDQVNSLFESWLTMDMSKIKNIVHSKDNVIIKVLDNNAWVICDNIWKYERDGESVERSEIQITFLEKNNKEWKISFNAIVSKPGPNREKTNASS